MFARAFAKAHKIAAQHAVRLQAIGRDAGFTRKKDTRGELYIYEGIGDSFWGGGVTDKQVLDALAKLKGVAQLDIYINSEGGDVFEARRSTTPSSDSTREKTVHIDGLAASAASFIAMAATRSSPPKTRRG
jgi:ATP-dependent Clp protease protease subunit